MMGNKGGFMLRKYSIGVIIVTALVLVDYANAGVSNNISEEARNVPCLLNYQGYLTDTLGVPINDTLDMAFSIYGQISGGTKWWSETQYAIPIERGIFQVMLGDSTAIPDSVFIDGIERWLEIVLEGPVTLGPRTRITAVGYAYDALHCDTAEYARNMAADDDWVRGTPDSVLFTAHYVGIARGGVNNVLHGNYPFTHTNFGVACTTGHSVLDQRYVTVGGGYGNAAIRDYATVAGGYSNQAYYDYAVVAGGYNNTARGDYSAVCGGQNNEARDYSTVCGGQGNVARDYAVVGGGVSNIVDNTFSFIGCGEDNYNSGAYSAILVGYADTIAYHADYSYLFGIGSMLTQDSTFMVDMPHIRFGDELHGYEFPYIDGSSDQVLVTDGSGQLSWQDGDSWSHWELDATLLKTKGTFGLSRGSTDNYLWGDSVHNHVNFGIACTTGTSGTDKRYVTVSGGRHNVAADHYTTVSGGGNNTASFVWSTVGGGLNNAAIDTGTVISGGTNNTASANQAVVGGGASNVASNDYAVVCGGLVNEATGEGSFIGSGYNNDAVSNYSTVSGGSQNAAGGSYSTVGGGYSNSASLQYTAVLGGNDNTAYGSYSVIGGGSENRVAGDFAVIVGGYADSITNAGDYSYLFGIASKCTQDSTFMVDMPHIWFGDEAGGYEFPVADGNSGEVMVTDGSGQLSWGQVADDDWERDTPDSVLFTTNLVGIARGGAGNVLYGDVEQHVNFGRICTTGTSGCDPCGDIAILSGFGNKADSSYATVVNGVSNKARGQCAFIGNGWGNTASGGQSFIGGGEENSAGGFRSFVGSGYSNMAGSAGDTAVVVVGGWNNSAVYNCAFVGGGFNNSAAFEYTTIGGGSGNTATYYYATVCGGYENTASNNSSTVAGGRNNESNGLASFVGAGRENVADYYYSVVCGGRYDTVYAFAGGILSGYNNVVGDEANDTAACVVCGSDNKAIGRYAFVGGGRDNTASGLNCFVGGGSNNTASIFRTVVGGGENNTASGDRSAIIGGRDNRAAEWYAVVAGGYADTVYGRYGGVLSGYSNRAGSGAYDSATVVVGGWNNTSAGSYTFVGGGKNNTSTSVYGFVGGGYLNIASGTYCTMVGGGYSNEATAVYASILGGYNNTAEGTYGVTCGGRENTVSSGGTYGVVCGGYLNESANTYCAVVNGYAGTASGQYNFIGSGSGNTTSGSFAVIGSGYADTVEAHLGGILAGSNNLAGDGANDSAAVVVGGMNNRVTAQYSFIGGGLDNTVPNSHSVVCGGRENRANAGYTTIAGGYLNRTGDQYASILAGYADSAMGYASTVCGGRQNQTDGSHAFVGGGQYNSVSGSYSVITGGYHNTASGNYSAIPGGYFNVADGYCSFAFGRYANTSGYDSVAVFNWGTGLGTVFIGQNASATAYRLYVNGSAYCTGSWATSDEQFKTDVHPITSALAVVARMNPVKFMWKEGFEEYGIQGGKEDYGFIAQELDDVLPELVGEGASEHHLAVNYNHITAVNTAAIKELVDIIENQQKEIDELRAEIRYLKDR
jgi:hypothetical protein